MILLNKCRRWESSKCFRRLDRPLPDGVNYPAETALVAKAKQIQVKITNSGHHK